MLSEELRELDRNTVQYMIDDMKDEIDAQKVLLNQKDSELDAQRKILSQKDAALAEKEKEKSLTTNH